LTATITEAPEKVKNQSERPGDRQQHRTDRGVGSGPFDIPVDLAVNGTFHAPVCRNQRLYVAGMGSSADEKTDHVYDDDQVYFRHGHYDWPAPPN
jgi:hypothetical protein